MINSVGFKGEEFVAAKLKELGWSILERNFRVPFGELDIIARDPEGVLVIIEVKTLRASDLGLKPEDNLTLAKLDKLKRTAEFYVNLNPQLVHKKGWRLDLAALLLTEIEKNCVLKIYPNILFLDRGV